MNINKNTTNSCPHLIKTKYRYLPYQIEFWNLRQLLIDDSF